MNKLNSIPQNQLIRGVNIICFVANGPRGYMMIPRFAAMTSPGEVFINLYSDFSAHFNLSEKNEILFKQQINYPESDKNQYL